MMTQSHFSLALAEGWNSEPWAQIAWGVTVGAAALWVGVDQYGRWRRRAANLTPVSTAQGSGTRPAFLTVDGEAREAALERADDYESHLREREAEARRAAEAAAEKRGAEVKRFAGAVSLFMSLFTLASMVAGAVWQVTWIGTVLERYTATERLEAVVRAHPVAFSVAVIVIAYHVYSFFSERKWQPAA